MGGTGGQGRLDFRAVARSAGPAKGSGGMKEEIVARKTKKSATKKYEVTVRPRFDNTFDYTVEVAAKNASEAVAIARKTARKNIQRDLRELAVSTVGGLFTVDFSASAASAKGELREYHREDDYETEETA